MSVLSIQFLYLLSLGMLFCVVADGNLEYVPYELHFRYNQSHTEVVNSRNLGDMSQLRRLEGVALEFEFNNEEILCDLGTPETVFTDKALERMGETNPPKSYISSDCVLTFLSESEFDGLVLGQNGAYHFHRKDDEQLEIDFSEETVQCIARQPNRRRRLKSSPESDIQEEHVHEIGRMLATPSLWSNCYPGVNSGYKFNIGVAVTSAFKSLVGGVSSTVQSMVSQTNLIYKNQMNINLKVDHLYTGSGPWNNAGCSMDIGKQLDSFSRWSKPSTQGVWHLFDDCFGKGPNGNVAGVAWIGTLCEGLNAGVNYCTGSKCNRGWKTFAHELGHNFNARHSFEDGAGKTGGIMDYGDGKVNGIYQFNTKYRRTEVCRELSSKVGSCSSFISNGGGSNPTPKPTLSSRSNPTKRPTKKPTKRPTPRPTNKKPTKRPTPRPTKKRPTPHPTKKRKPTPRPTPHPTKPKPTPHPTKKRKPTPRPTPHPTKGRPTPHPTKKRKPTPRPTPHPTKGRPTPHPTKSSRRGNTPFPSSFPTRFPRRR